MLHVAPEAILGEKFKQDDDHVRYYGRRDYIDRLKSVGFEVLVLPKQELLGETALKRLSVDAESDVILVQKGKL